MLLVIPVSSSDQKLIPAFLKGFENFHPGSGHKLLVVGNPAIEETVRSVEATLAKYFSSTANFLTSTDNRMGWPMAVNYLFYEASRHILQSYTPEDAFLWMELDSTPLKTNWLTTIATTYFADSSIALTEGRQPKLYLGAEVITRESRNGEILPISETGTHMGAVGVYPQDVATRSKMLKVTPNIQKAFYEYIQWDVVPNMQKSNLIQHNWMTRNYRRENTDEIVSDSANRFAYGINYNEPVSPNAVLLHGVKDGSLQALLGGKELPQLSVAPPKVEPEQVEAVVPENEMVEVLTRDPATGRITGEYISRKELELRQQEELRQAEIQAKQLMEKQAIEAELNKFRESVQNDIQVGNQLVEEAINGPELKNYPVPDVVPEVKELLDNRMEPLPEPVLSNNNPIVEAVKKFEKTRRGRGPGRPKKQKRNLSDEQRIALQARMREVAKIAHAKRAEKNQQGQEVNG